MKKITLVCASVITSFLIWGCKDPESSSPNQNCTPADGKMVELTTPVVGKTYKIGDTVKIEYKIDASQLKQTAMAIIEVSIDNGISWSIIPDHGTSVPLSQGQYQCLSYDWIIGKENETVDYGTVNDKCILRICEYSNEKNGVIFSQYKFTITK